MTLPASKRRFSTWPGRSPARAPRNSRPREAPSFSPRARGTLSVAVAFSLVPRFGQPQSYHDFADQRSFLGIPRFADVISTLPFAVIGVWGTIFILRTGGPRALAVRAPRRQETLRLALQLLIRARFQPAPVLRIVLQQTTSGRKTGALEDIPDDDPIVEELDCSYPLINRCNQTPYHCLHGFMEFLNERLDLSIKATAFKGDIHLSPQEKTWYSQVYELTREDVPFWIVAAGGKYDVTIKWWQTERYQTVVDHFRGRIQFVQVGELGHHHPRLKGVIDLRGKTSLRQLIRLVLHAQGPSVDFELRRVVGSATGGGAGKPRVEVLREMGADQVEGGERDVGEAARRGGRCRQGRSTCP